MYHLVEDAHVRMFPPPLLFPLLLLLLLIPTRSIILVYVLRTMSNVIRILFPNLLSKLARVISNDVVTPKYLPTSDMTSDLLAKPLPRSSFLRLRQLSLALPNNRFFIFSFAFLFFYISFFSLLFSNLHPTMFSTHVFPL